MRRWSGLLFLSLLSSPLLMVEQCLQSLFFYSPCLIVSWGRGQKKKRVSQQRETKVCDCLGFVCVLVLADSLQPHGLQPTRLLCPWGFPGKDTGVVCCFLLQGIFPTQGLNLGLLNCKQILYWLGYQGSCGICSLGIISKILPLFFLIHLSPSKSFFLHVFLYPCLLRNSHTGVQTNEIMDISPFLLSACLSVTTKPSCFWQWQRGLTRICWFPSGLSDVWSTLSVWYIPG